MEVLEVLASRLAKLPRATLYPLWCETLHIISQRTRRNLLTDLSTLAPVIFALGGTVAVVETCRSILEVGYWWP